MCSDWAKRDRCQNVLHVIRKTHDYSARFYLSGAGDPKLLAGPPLNKLGGGEEGGGEKAAGPPQSDVTHGRAQ